MDGGRDLAGVGPVDPSKSLGNGTEPYWSICQFDRCIGYIGLLGLNQGYLFCLGLPLSFSHV